MNKKVALITGASSGIGLDTALLLLENGCTVYAGARRLERMKEIKSNGGYIFPLDVTNEESMVDGVKLILEKEGRIDILINNAGYGSGGSIEEIPIDEVKHQYEVNVFGMGRMIQLVLPTMRSQRSGTIINIGSMGGHFTSPYLGWYHSTKYAVVSISDALRMELSPFSINVSCIDPGMIDTNWGIIAAENIRKTAQIKDYQGNAASVAKYYDAHYGQNPSPLSNPNVIAKTILKAVQSKHPKGHYYVGTYSKLFIFLKWLLPNNLFQKVTCSSMGLK